MIQDLILEKELAWEEISIKRNEFLIRPGIVEKYIYYVKEGAVRAFTLIGDEDFTIRLGYSQSIITAIPSYFDQKPSKLYIQALRKTTLLRSTKTKFEAFMEKDLENLKLYNALLKEFVSSFYEREIDLLSQSPQERIERILKRSPQVLQEIPHKYIASYLRMSPETFSRLLNS